MDVHGYMLQAEKGKVPWIPLEELAPRFGTTARTVRKYAGGGLRKTDRGWIPAARDSLTKPMTLIVTPADIVEGVPIRGAANRSDVAKHHAAIERFLDGDPAHLRNLKRATVTDANGRRYRLLTDERELLRMNRAGQFRGVTPY
jgi:hypothetical protein